MRIAIVVLRGFLLAGFGFVLTALAPAPAAADEPMNACGCYRDSAGVCKCTRKSKCGCPEECEPMGCEAKRQREADRAAEAALKGIAERERKKNAEAAQNAKTAAKAAAEKRKKTAEEERSDKIAAELLRNDPDQGKAKARLETKKKGEPKPEPKKPVDPLQIP